MPELADKAFMEAYDAQQGIPQKGIRVRFFKGAEPDNLATDGCRRDCQEQHAHLDTCNITGCAPTCNLQHPHADKCALGCAVPHHSYFCQNKHHILKAGRQVFREIIYLKKVIPGDVLCSPIVRPMRLEDQREFPSEWAAFEKGIEAPTGTSLDLVPFLNEAQKAEFRAAGCQTAEDIAHMSDTVAQKFMGIHGLRKRIGEFLAAAAGNAPIQKMSAELEKKEAKIQQLIAKMEELTKRVDKATAKE